MAKKRKTRKEKEIVRHDFLEKQKPAEEKSVEKPEVAEKKSVKKNVTDVPGYVFSDLKKVGMVIGGIILVLLILSYLIYKTDIFNFIFSKIGISY